MQPDNFTFRLKSPKSSHLSSKISPNPLTFRRNPPNPLTFGRKFPQIPSPLAVSLKGEKNIAKSSHLWPEFPQILSPFAPNPLTFRPKSSHLSPQILSPFAPNPLTFRLKISFKIKYLRLVLNMLNMLNILNNNNKRRRRDSDNIREISPNPLTFENMLLFFNKNLF
ncbi:MAG: hypothetical protein U1F76_18030 [Candidatus Competibacteraceae bacterium]